MPCLLTLPKQEFFKKIKWQRESLVVFFSLFSHNTQKPNFEQENFFLLVRLEPSVKVTGYPCLKLKLKRVLKEVLN